MSNHTLSSRFRAATGSNWYLHVEDPARIDAYLRTELNFLLPGEKVQNVQPAGEGNMNLSLRVYTERRRFILKQSRPWVAKFPDLDAPVERLLIERDFARAVQGDHFLSGHMPELLRTDTGNYVLILEDLGQIDDLTSIYQQGRNITANQLDELLEYAGRLHRIPGQDFPKNRALRQLNHAHIFDLPFRPDNGFPLNALHPGLADLARPYQHDERLRAVVTELGKRYLGPGRSLIHGDYYPGSFLQTRDRLYVIDAEFAHCGLPEFDLGVLLAHLLVARTPEERLLQVNERYRRPPNFDVSLVRKFCYVEVMRRLIGIAQLPMDLSLEERQALLERARVGLLE